MKLLLSKISSKLSIARFFSETIKNSLIFGFVAILGFVFLAQQIALAATSVAFYQESWSGGVTSTAASDPTDRTGWNGYSTSTYLDFTITNALRLTSSTFSFVDDITSTYSGLAFGGGFLSGTLNQVQLLRSSLNTTGYVALATTTEVAINAFDSLVPAIPGQMGLNGKIIATSTYIYILQVTSTSFVAKVHRYDYSANVMASYTDSPSAAGTNVTMTIDDTYIYLLLGTGTSFYRHAISNTLAGWESFTALPGSVGTAAAVVVDETYLYVARGSSTNIYRHAVSNTSASWDSFTVLPSTLSSGGKLLVDANYLYVLPGNSVSTTYRHSKTSTSTSWEAFTNLPYVVTSGSQAALDANYLYVIASTAAGGAGTTTLRHDLTNTSSAWEAFTTLPAAAATVSGLEVNANYLFFSRGSAAQVYRHTTANTSSAWDTITSTVAFSSTAAGLSLGTDFLHVFAYPTSIARHAISDTSSAWIGSTSPNFPPLPALVGGGALPTFSINKNNLYVLAGSSPAIGFFRHDLISTTSAWASSTAPAATLGNGTSLVVDENFAYAMLGSTTGFYRRSLSATPTSSWDSYAAAPTSTGSTASIAVNGDYLYFLQGNTAEKTGLYRHLSAVTSSAWESFTALPAAMGGGASFVFDNDYVYVVRGGSTSSTYRHALNSTSTAWDTFTNLPGNVSVAAGSNSLMAINDTHLYVVQGGSTGFYRHVLSNTSSAWESFTAMPGNTASRATVLLTDTYAYVLQGNSSGVGFWRHTLASTSTAWEVLQAQPCSVSNGGGMVFSQDKDIIYLICGSSSDLIFRFVVNDLVYSSSGDFTSPALSLGAARLESVRWSSSTPVVTGSSALRLQIATSSDNSTYSSYFGPDGTVGTYFTTGSTTLTGAITAPTQYLKYKAYLSTDNTDFSPRLEDITFNYSAYSASGTLISSVYNSNDSGSKISGLEWTGTTSASATLRFQIRTGDSTITLDAAEWVGPDNTSSTYFSTSGSETLNSAFTDGAGDQFVQYKALFSSSGATSPVLSDVALSFIPPNNSAPVYGGSSPPLIGYSDLEAAVSTPTTTVVVVAPTTTPATSTLPVAPTTTEPVVSPVLPEVAPVIPTQPTSPGVALAPVVALKQALGTARLTKVLQTGTVDSQVRLLQRALNALGFTVAKSGPGSPGKETNYFGSATRLALIRFQEANAKSILTPLGLTKGTGKFAAGTRAFIMDLLRR